MFPKIPFYLLEKIVDGMYDFSITSEKEIDKRCLDIQDVIVKSGWDIDDYIRTMMGFSSVVN